MKEIYIVRNLNFSYEDKIVFSEVSFKAFEGKLTLLAGKTGSGKTTFLDLLFGVLRPASGEVLFSGRKVISSEAMVGLVSYLISEPERYFFESTVVDEVKHVIKFTRRNTDIEPEKMAEEALLRVGFGKEMLDRDPLTLSKGEKRKLAIASILAGSSKVLLMDEPLAGLDYPGMIAVVLAIGKLINEGFSVIAASHEIDPFLELKPDIFVLHNEKLREVEIDDVTLAQEVFEDAGLLLPERLRLAAWLRKKGVSIEIQKNEAEFLKSAVEALKRCI